MNIINLRLEVPRLHQIFLELICDYLTYDSFIELLEGNAKGAYIVGGRIYRSLVKANQPMTLMANCDWDALAVGRIKSTKCGEWRKFKLAHKFLGTAAETTAQTLWGTYVYTDGEWQSKPAVVKTTSSSSDYAYFENSVKFVNPHGLKADIISPIDICGKAPETLNHTQILEKYFARVPLTIQQVAYDYITQDLWITLDALDSIYTKTLYWNNKDEVGDEEYIEKKCKTLPRDWTHKENNIPLVFY